MNDERLKELYASSIARRAASPGDCPPPEALLALARREGDEEARLRTLDHVMACGAGCARELELLRAIVHAGEGIGQREVGSQRRTSIGARRWFVPALAAASVALAVGIGVNQRGAHRGEDARLRGAGDETTVSLAAPDEGAVSLGGATLAWHPLTGARAYTVEVLDASGSVVATARSLDTAYVFRGAPAAYRWWVRADLPSGEVRSPLRALVVRGQ